jgi:hypothetical protein
MEKSFFGSFFSKKELLALLPLALLPLAFLPLAFLPLAFLFFGFPRERPIA